ncbi:sensor histidine kinase [Geodermatophilus obscurus]|uniref:Integral membrane sensor signal transduction histidine kinase n=1 Tax=Geodermatophilus obscurus (strain ATCC 25078 / DSM 43160 / JCM 3152 / CCUG 61914 / KCC A-0152 / KCTC 9177 / NBRC 13315 / NRRL B-3577 / G-20) TaxID=526225 RepID=D2S9S7_GEOOG|nr:sensor histidine kinase [Geodermatophilus obscurus]ADB73790.1 integral membrane sensor signal transduction histidine kinase [Geodermatophilus obscurus DSM 43160]
MSLTRRLAAAVVPPEDDGGEPLPERGWRATVVGVHVISAVVWTLAVVSAAVGDAVDDDRRTPALAVLAALAVAYAALGVPAIGAGARRRAVAYLVVLVAAFGLLGWLASGLLFLLFLAYPHVWFAVQGTLTGITWTLLLGLASAVGPLLSATSARSPGDLLLETGVGIAFSLALGVWISRVLRESAERASLIAQLEATRSELAAAERERGVLAERERLAQEVHDTLAQGYTSIVVLAQTADALLPADPEAARERLAVIEEVARDNLAEARAVVAAFRPVALDGSTLVEALRRLAERFARETGLEVRVDTGALDAAPGLRRDEEVVLLRGAQEALTNVRRHAGATAVVLRLSRVGSQVSVHVEDDGVGFDPASASVSGLEGLRGRVEQVGGEVDVASLPGAGTRVTVRVPGA